MRKLRVKAQKKATKNNGTYLEERNKKDIEHL
jgi:hypothetical protein